LQQQQPSARNRRQRVCQLTVRLCTGLANTQTAVICPYWAISGPAFQEQPGPGPLCAAWQMDSTDGPFRQPGARACRRLAGVASRRAKLHRPGPPARASLGRWGAPIWRTAGASPPSLSRPAFLYSRQQWCSRRLSAFKIGGRNRRSTAAGPGSGSGGPGSELHPAGKRNGWHSTTQPNGCPALRRLAQPARPWPLVPPGLPPSQRADRWWAIVGRQVAGRSHSHVTAPAPLSTLASGGSLAECGDQPWSRPPRRCLRIRLGITGLFFKGRDCSVQQAAASSGDPCTQDGDGYFLIPVGITVCWKWKVIEGASQLRFYTQDNQDPVWPKCRCSSRVCGPRPVRPIKVVGWGNLAQGSPEQAVQVRPAV